MRVHLFDYDFVWLVRSFVDITSFCLSDSASLFVDNVARFVQGEALVNVVDKGSFYLRLLVIVIVVYRICVFVCTEAGY